MKTTFMTMAEAVKHFGGEGNTLAILGKYADNAASRTEYNKVKNATQKAALSAITSGKIPPPEGFKVVNGKLVSA